MLKAGDAFQIPPNTPHAGGKAGTAKTKILITYVVENKPLGRKNVIPPGTFPVSAPFRLRGILRRTRAGNRGVMERSDRFADSLTDDGRYRLLIEAVTDYAIYMLDPTGIVTSWNPGAQRFKGYTADEIVGEHFSRFYSAEDRAAAIPTRALETAGAHGKVRGRRLARAQGRQPLLGLCRHRSDPLAGRRDRRLCQDHARPDRAARGQQKLDKTREALLQSQKMEAIGQLTGGIAHDFNNLLMAVLGSLELMRKRLPDDPKLQTLLENAVQGAQRGTTLTQRMLAFARRQELKQEAVDLPELVRGMTELLQRSLGPSVGIETRFPLGLQAGASRRKPARNGAAQSRGERARRHAGRRRRSSSRRASRTFVRATAIG